MPGSTTQPLAEGKILLDIADGIGTITFNNPEKRNAMSLAMWEALGDALAVLRDDPAVHVVVLMGAGGKAFVSGADISQFEKERHDAASAEIYAGRSNAGREALAAFPKPTIACITGFCIGGGLQLAMLADMRFAAEGSQFGIPAAKLGLAYGYDGLRNLVSLVGPSWARFLMFTGMRIDAAEALRIGLIERVYPVSEVMNATLTVARTIAENAPLAVQAARLTIGELLKDPDQRDMAGIKQISTACMNSADFREGRQAFMEKRAPRFNGR